MSRAPNRTSSAQQEQSTPTVPGLPPVPLPPPGERPLLSRASVDEMDQVAQETLRAQQTRTSGLEPNLLLTREAKITRHLTPDPALVAADAPDVLAGLRFMLAQGFEDLKKARGKAPFAYHGGRRYSVKARTLRRLAAKLFASIRRRANERIERTAENAEIRLHLGVNAAVVLTNPQSLLAGLVAQRDVCRDAALQAQLTAAGMNPRKCVERLDAMIGDLEEAIREGTLGEAKKSEVEDAVNQALVKIEIVLSRARAFLEDYVSEAAAEAMETDVPRRRGRAAAGEEEDDGEPPTGGGGGGEGGAAPSVASATPVPSAGGAGGAEPAAAPAPVNAEEVAGETK